MFRRLRSVSSLLIVATLSSSLAGGQDSVPPEPMQPRLGDWRAGFYPDYQIRMFDQGPYIWRWRLVKKDVAAPISDVVQSIRVRIASDVPQKWIPSIKQVVEDWNRVFESIGFRNALVTEGVFPDTVPGDRTILFRWDSSPSDDAGTQSSEDDTTREIRRATIRLADGVLLATARSAILYGMIPRKAGPPFDDTLLATFLVPVIAHEMGHALGLGHNLRGGTSYPVDSLRNRSFVQRNGITSSIMAGSPQFLDRVAQAEDRIPFKEMIARIGPYDRATLAWGYRPIPEASTPQDEQPELARWLSAQDSVPSLRSAAWLPNDPSEFLGVGDDPVKSAGYVIRNLARAAAGFDPHRDVGPPDAQANVYAPEPFAYYTNSLGFWNNEIARVLMLVGGQIPRTPYPSERDSLVVLPVDSARQIEAIRFLFAHTLYGYDALIRDQVLAHLPKKWSGQSLVLFDTVAPGWSADAWRKSQQMILQQLVDHERLLRIPIEVRHALCRELQILDQRLSRVAVDASASTRQRHARALRTTIAPTVSTCRAEQ